jgi:hypothetical protein
VINEGYKIENKLIEIIGYTFQLETENNNEIDFILDKWV